MANRQEILDQFAQNFGLVPDVLSEMPDAVLEPIHQHTLLGLERYDTLGA
jgi:hypothetical protein